MSDWQPRLEAVHRAIDQLYEACEVDGDASRSWVVDRLDELFSDVTDARTLRQRARSGLGFYVGGMGSFQDVGTSIMGDAVDTLRLALHRAARFVYLNK